MTDTPHDTLFKATFTHLPWAVEILRAALGPLAARVDLTSLQVVPGSFIDEAFRSRHTDLLFSATLDDRPGLLYLLFEHQSGPERWMPLRMLGYTERVWQWFLRDDPHARQLPAIIPIVLHHDASPWRTPTELADLIDLPAASPLRAHVPRLRLVLDDLTAATDAALHARATSASVELVLLALKHARSAAHLNVLLSDWVDLFDAVLREPNGVRAMRLVFRYLLQVRGAEERDVLDAIATELDTKGSTMQSIAEWLEERGEKRGEQRGEQRGRLHGQQQLLLRLLRRRFGDLSASVVSRIEAADASTLERWADQLLTADTLAAVFV